MTDLEKLRNVLDRFRARAMAHWYRGDFDSVDVATVIAKVEELQKWIDLDLVVLSKKVKPAAPKETLP